VSQVAEEKWFAAEKTIFAAVRLSWPCVSDVPNFPKQVENLFISRFCTDVLDDSIQCGNYSSNLALELVV